MPVDSICWKAGACRIIDQTLLPEKLRYLKLTNIRDMWEAIRHLRVRGAPALGIAAAYGLYLGIRDSKSSTFSSFMKDLNQAADYLKTSRPTAINLFWALERMKQKAEDVSHLPIASIKQSLLDEAHRIWKEDYEAGVAMGDAGAALIVDYVLTIAISVASRQVSGSSPLTWKIGASIIFATSEQYVVPRVSRGSEVVKPIWLLTMMWNCLLYTSPSPRDRTRSRMPSSA